MDDYNDWDTECKCGAAGEEDHTCPYDQELGDGTQECNCCKECTNDCAMDI